MSEGQRGLYVIPAKAGASADETSIQRGGAVTRLHLSQSEGPRAMMPAGTNLRHLTWVNVGHALVGN